MNASSIYSLVNNCGQLRETVLFQHMVDGVNYQLSAKSFQNNQDLAFIQHLLKYLIGQTA